MFDLFLINTYNTVNTDNTDSIERKKMFLISLQGKESIFEQIVKQIEDYISKGILKANDKLPSVREVAKDLGINPNTVSKAYQTLEAKGLIYTLNKKGAYVKDNDSINLDDKTINLLSSLKDSGYSKTDLMKLIDEVYKEVKDA